MLRAIADQDGFVVVDCLCICACLYVKSNRSIHALLQETAWYACAAGTAALMSSALHAQLKLLHFTVSILYRRPPMVIIALLLSVRDASQLHECAAVVKHPIISHVDGGRAFRRQQCQHMKSQQYQP